VIHPILNHLKLLETHFYLPRTICVGSVIPDVHHYVVLVSVVVDTVGRVNPTDLLVLGILQIQGDTKYI
jgi:hypothetical protein